MIDDLQRYGDLLMHEENNLGRPQFEGYSPNEMARIIYHTFDGHSPIRLMPLKAADYGLVPIVRQVLYLTKLIQKSGEIKLTQKGFLPPRIVTELASQEFLMKEAVEWYRPNYYREADSLSTTLTRLILKLAGVIKKRKNRLSLTKYGEKLLSDHKKLFLAILAVYCKKFNWAYTDSYGDNHIGQVGYGFSMILLEKYGNEPLGHSFYAKKYFTAFPMLASSYEPSPYGFDAKRHERCYILRTFERFLLFFGLVNISQKNWDSEVIIQKTELFDRLFRCMPPSTSKN